MRLQIMQNLEITVENLHISYETISTTKLGHPFSFGITLHHLDMTVNYLTIIRNLQKITILDNNKSSIY